METTQPHNPNPSGGRSDYDDVLTDHSYDGIQEYDNPMPSWWKLLFYVSIVWAVIYVAGIAVGAVNTYEDDLKTGQAELADIRAQYARENAGPKVSDELILTASKDAGVVKKGAEVFGANCAACHGDKGQGLIGPNLADKFWLHGGKPTSVYKSIADGITTKGMPAWLAVLGEDDTMAVMAFVTSIQGTEPAGGKAPQGKPYEPKAAAK